MSGLKTQLKAAAERIDAMGLRERGLMFLVLMGVLYMAASTLAFGPLTAEQVRLERELKARHDQTRAMQTQIQELLGHTTGAGTAKDRLQILRETLQGLDKSLTGITQSLVSPQEMARLIEQMLAQNRRLEVIKLENLPPAPLAADGGGLGQPLYKHGMRIRFKGRYADVVQYLRTLERLPWKVFWGEVSLQADASPLSTVTLVIYTLSLRQSWIGV